MDNAVKPSQVIHDWKNQLWAAIFMYATSLLLPSVSGMGKPMYGWEAFLFSMLALSDNLGSKTDVWLINAGIANLLLLVLPALILFKRNIAGICTMLAAIFCVFATSKFLFLIGLKDLYVGYYFWLASALLTLTGSFYAYREKRAARKALNVQMEKDDINGTLIRPPSA